MELKISSCVEKILSSFRLLEYSVVDSNFQEIEETLKGNPLDQKYTDKISALVLPIFYPGDYSNFRLKFSIQCMACSHLLKLSPDLQFDILVSIMDIFHQYPHIFIGKTSIKNVLKDFFFYVKDPWDIFNKASQGRSNDFNWCFFMFCFDNIEQSRQIPNWDLVLQLISDPNLYSSRKIDEILTFLEQAYYNWGANPSLSPILTEYSLRFTLAEADIPPFLYTSNSDACTIEEKTIKVISLHLSGSTPITARSLSLISRQDGHFMSPIYQVSLFLAILRTIPSNFKNTLAQRIKLFIKKTEFTEKVCAHIVATSSLCQINDFSIIETFSDAFSTNEQKKSLFFAYLADCSQSLDLNSTVPLINDAFASIASSGPAYGVCKFISSLLSKCRLHTEILTEQDIVNMKNYINVFIGIVDKQCSSNSQVTPDIEKMVKLSSKIIAKLGIICNEPLLLPLDQPNICQTYFACAVCSYFLSYSSNIIVPLDYAFNVFAVCEFSNFTEFSQKIKSHICRLLNSTDFPPVGFEFSEESSRTLLNSSLKAFRTKSCPTETFYKTIIPLLPCVTKTNNSYLIREFIKNFWNEKTANDIPIESISFLLSLYDGYDTFFKLFVILLKNNSDKLYNQVNSILSSNHHFRSWFVEKFLSSCAFFFPKAFKIGKNIYLTPSEFKSFLYALRKVLPKTTNPSAVRAAAIKFVGRYLDMCPVLSKYCVSSSINSLINKKEMPEFPTNEELGIPLNENEVYSTNQMTILTNEMNNYTYVDNRNASSLELNASLNILTKSIENNSNSITDSELDSIHRTLRRSNDPRIRKPYLKFLSSLGLKGVAYACQISSNVPITPFF